MTSVQARTPYRRSTAAAWALEVSIVSMAASRSSARVLPRIAPASRAPVPMGLVSTSFSPGESPSLAKGSPCSRPETVNAMPSSAASAEWPPTRSTPWARKTASAPAIIWNKSSSIMAGAIDGTVAKARAKEGLAPIAKMSFKAWWALTRPKR